MYEVQLEHEQQLVAARALALSTDDVHCLDAAMHRRRVLREGGESSRY